MSVKQFLSDDNIKILWDLITEEELFKNKPNDMKHNISQMFINNIEGFYHAEKTNAKSLVDLNKKYMIAILNFIKQIQIPKIQNTEKLLAPQALTHEMFQQEKRTQFERDFEKRQNEFESSMSLPKPQVPEFSDKTKDAPLKNMEDILKQMTAQRNYDIYNITNAQQNGNTDFLKPLETSIKNEKLMQKEFAETTLSKNLKPVNTRPDLSRQENEIRYIKIEKEDLDKNIINSHLIELPSNNDSPKKQLTWGEDQVYYQTNDSSSFNNDFEDIDLFKRLKKQPIPDPTAPNFQKQIDDLNTKVDHINANINMILDLLRKKSEIV